MKNFLFVLLVIGLLLSSGPVLAKDGFYMGMDLGVAVAPEMDMQIGGLDDWSPSGFDTKCDATINPGRLQGGHCTDNPIAWDANESFDGGSGILAGLALGYRLGSFRVEGEYFYRNTNYDSTATPIFDGGWNPNEQLEYGLGDDSAPNVEDAVDDLLSHNVFANLYYDYRSDSKFTPYLGIGIGLARVSVAYRTRWQRSTDPEKIDVFDRGEPGEELNQKLAGTLTHDRARMSDTLFGYQALAGVDYQVSEPFTIGLKFRYAMFGEFEDESEYTKLRGHDPVVGNPPTVPATYYTRTDDIQFWGVSLNMKYQF